MRRLLLVLAIAACACGRDIGPPVTAVDLVKLADRAERRPAGARFDMAERVCGTTLVSGLDVPVPSRIIYRMNFPRRARLISVPVIEGPQGSAAEFRIGISDRRVYETLSTHVVSSGDCAAPLAQISVDLSRYAGWQWSLFYRPDEREWELILGVTAVNGEVQRAMWGALGIEASSRDARTYMTRER